jgi:putative ABC transport system permease protein
LTISALVFIASCFGVAATILSSIRERTHELILMRALGAPPTFIFKLIAVEAMLITTVSIILSISLMYLTTTAFQEVLSINVGVNVEPYFADYKTLQYAILLLGGTAVIALIPGYRAYSVSRPG